MPQAAGAWAAYIAAGITTSGTLVAAAFYAAYGATVLGISLGLSKLSAALAGRPKLGSDMQSRKVTVRSSTEYRTILYGSGRTGGVLVHIGTAGLSNQFLDFVVAIAGHEIDAITDVWFDDVKIPVADINSGDAAGGAVGGTGKYRERDGEPVAWIYKYLGTDTQTASTILDGSYSEWTSDHRLRGCAYAHIRLRRHSGVYEQGAPNNFTFGFRGAKVYDPRKDSSLASYLLTEAGEQILTEAGEPIETEDSGDGAHRVDDPSTWSYSNNWALCVADYLIGGTVTNSATRVNWRGFGADPDDVIWSTVIAAANIADEDVLIPPASPATYQNRYTCDGAMSSGGVPADNLEQLLTAGLGQLTYSSDGYRLYAGAYQTSAIELTEDDLAGDISVVSDTPRADRYNAVRGTRWDTAAGQEVEFLPRTSPSYELLDGGAQLFREIELPLTTDEYRAQRLAQIILTRSREQETVTMHCNPSALRVGVWETVALTIAELGIAGKTFRCLAREEREDLSVILTLREEYPATYADPILDDYGDLTPAVPDLLEGVTPQPPQRVVAQPIVDGILFSWEPDTSNPAVGVTYRIYEYTSATPFASATRVADGLTGTSRTIIRTDTSTRYYWMTALYSGLESDEVPSDDGIAAAALTITAGFRANGSSSQIFSFTFGATKTTGSVTVTPANGAAPYTYAWTRTSGSTKLSAASATSATTAFNAVDLVVNEPQAAIFRCTVTDNASATATWDVYVSVARIQIV